MADLFKKSQKLNPFSKINPVDKATNDMLNGMLTKPKVPKAGKAVAIPDLNDAKARQAAADAQAEILRRRGRSSTMLSGVAGDSTKPTTSGARLLGRGG